MLQLIYFVFACVNCPFYLPGIFFTPKAKDPFYIRKVQVNACPYAPPSTPKHKHATRIQCMPWVQANMEAIAWIFFCSVPIIWSHVSKWYSTTKRAKYAQPNCLSDLQM